jgi:hypothetical protein
MVIGPFGTQEFHRNYIGISHESVHFYEKNTRNGNIFRVPKAAYIRSSHGGCIYHHTFTKEIDNK